MSVVDVHPWDDKGRGHYTLNMLCSNCGWRFVGRFIKGFRASGSYGCPKCGCNTATPSRGSW